MHSGRNSGYWLVRIVSRYPIQVLSMVILVSLFSVSLRDRSANTAAFSPALSTSEPPLIVGESRVIDGDTLHIGSAKIRLWGIDAPESQQTCDRSGKSWPCGVAAKNALSERIAGKQVSCREEATDRYDRIVAECFVEGQNLNDWLVANGWALAYRRYSSKFVATENIAKTEEAGLWQGSFTEPWEWRRQNR